MNMLEGLKSRIRMPTGIPVRLPSRPGQAALFVVAIALLLGSAGYVILAGGPSVVGGPRFTMAMPRTAPDRQALITPPRASPEAPKPPAGSVPGVSRTAPRPSAGAVAMPTGPGQAPPSFAALPQPPTAQPLADAPLPDLYRTTPKGNLPVIAGDGRTSATAYGRPFAGEPGRPRIAVVVADLGLDPDATKAAIARLPAEVTLAFSPYAKNIDAWIKEARAAGHEVLLKLPLEPMLFPAHDDGPLSLSAGMSLPATLDRLETILGTATGYVGLMGSIRSPMATSETMTAVMGALRERGLLYVGDAVPAQRPSDMPVALTTVVADEEPFRSAIDAQLNQATAAARRQGGAVVVLRPLPVTFERLAAWLATLQEGGVDAAPVSAIALGERRA